MVHVDRSRRGWAGAQNMKIDDGWNFGESCIGHLQGVKKKKKRKSSELDGWWFFVSAAVRLLVVVTLGLVWCYVAPGGTVRVSASASISISVCVSVSVS